LKITERWRGGGGRKLSFWLQGYATGRTASERLRENVARTQCIIFHVVFTSNFRQTPCYEDIRITEGSCLGNKWRSTLRRKHNHPTAYTKCVCVRSVFCTLILRIYGTMLWDVCHVLIPFPPQETSNNSQYFYPLKPNGNYMYQLL
jgi:hypothetical protein